MDGRDEVLRRLAEAAGADAVEIRRLDRGWPGLVAIKLAAGPAEAAVHVGPVGLSHRNRDDVERRFQNPGQGRAIVVPAGSMPLLLGWWEEAGKRVVVAFDASRRVGLKTRFSLFVPLWLLEKAAITGWAEHVSASGEPIVAFHPTQLPVYVEAQRQAVPIQADVLAKVLNASGLTDSASLPPEERARRAALTLVRDAAFGRRVIAAYEGLCAMCGVNLGLCEGAHIHPVGAPGSHDEVWNGLALCRNHHAAFDRHLIRVEPESSKVVIRPDLLKDPGLNPVSRSFLSQTLEQLRAPLSKLDCPKPEMFVKRYDFFQDAYEATRWTT